MIELLYIISCGILGIILFVTIRNYFDMELVTINTKAQKLMKPALSPKQLYKVFWLFIPVYYVALPVLASLWFTTKALQCSVCTTFWTSLILLLLISTQPVLVIIAMAFCSVFIGQLYYLIQSQSI